MKLKTLAKKAADLPNLQFEYGGPENWHEAVFEREITDITALKEYVDELRKRLRETTAILKDTVDAYARLRDLILEAEIEDCCNKS